MRKYFMVLVVLAAAVNASAATRTRAVRRNDPELTKPALSAPWAETLAPEIVADPNSSFASAIAKGRVYTAIDAQAQFLIWDSGEKVGEGPLMQVIAGGGEVGLPLQVRSSTMSYTLCVWNEGGSFCSNPESIPVNRDPGPPAP